jgi:hypothetical protein
LEKPPIPFWHPSEEAVEGAEGLKGDVGVFRSEEEGEEELLPGHCKVWCMVRYGMQGTICIVR